MRAQLSRAVIYNTAAVVGIASKLLGTLEVGWPTVFFFMLLTNISGLLFWGAARCGVLRPLGLRLAGLSLASDVLMITWVVFVTGGSRSTWFPWYMAVLAAAAYMGGWWGTLGAVCATTVAYLAVAVLTEGPQPSVIARALANLLMLFGANLFALLGISRLQEKRRTISRLREQEAARVAELEGLAGALENAYRSVVGLPGQRVFTAAADSVASLIGAPIVILARIVGEELEILASHGLVEGTLRLPLAGTPCQQVVRRRQPVAVEHGLCEQFGPSDAWASGPAESYFGLPLTGSTGEVLGVLAVVDAVPRQLTDVQKKVLEIHAVRVGRELERVKLEERQRAFEQRSIESQKLEALGVLAGGIAHEFNNVLAGISGTAEVLARSVANAEGERKVTRILQLAKRGGEVARRILAFSRGEVSSLRAVDLNAVVTEAIDLASHALGPEASILPQLEARLPTVDGDPALLQQAIVNLLINARDALPGGGEVRVRTLKRVDADKVVLEVEDAGTGMAPDVLAHAFDPFFTTKPVGKGSGLGLSMVYRTITALGGEVAIFSHLREGTRVRIELPVGKLAAASALPEPRSWDGAGVTLLLVDDEEPILESLSEILRLEGHRVLAASRPEDALRYWESAQGEIALAVLDVAMPGLSGPELAQRLRASKPGLPLLFSSGHAEQRLDLRLPGTGPVAFLQKPYTARELLDTIDRLCGGEMGAS
ncbi:MAG: ATP-binding protein [Acidobacteriota bacterium]